MTLIIGGRCAGKYQELIKLGYTKSDIGTDFNSKAIYKLNDLVKSMLEDNSDPVYNIKRILENSSGFKTETVVCDEVGAGIVPMNKSDREYREAVGRVCTLIADHADSVIRVYAGIAVKIK